MQYFKSDYMEGAHPLILERLCQTNMEKTSGYGTDEYCASARRKIAEACGCPQAEVHFMVGGTQTNSTVIMALLRPYEGVIAAETGHINQHEAGAVEAGGHKVLALPHHEGKLDAAEPLCDGFLSGSELGSHGGSGNGIYITSYGIRYTLYAG